MDICGVDTVASFFNGSQAFSLTAQTNTGLRNLEIIGASGAAIDPSRANWSEFIVYGTTNQTANQSAIATNVVAYY